jgi:hypothetical protein
MIFAAESMGYTGFSGAITVSSAKLDLGHVTFIGSLPLHQH